MFWKTSVNNCFWKSSPQWQIFRRKVILESFHLFRHFSTLNFSMTEWFYHVTCFAKVFLLLFFLSNMIFRSNHRRFSIKKVFLKFRKFDRKTPVLESLFDKITGLKACNFILKRHQHRHFPVKFPKILRSPILSNICERMLLDIFIIKKIVLQHTLSETLSFLHRWNYCWKCEFDTDVKME